MIFMVILQLKFSIFPELSLSRNPLPNCIISIIIRFALPEVIEPVNLQYAGMRSNDIFMCTRYIWYLHYRYSFCRPVDEIRQCRDGEIAEKDVEIGGKVITKVRCSFYMKY